MSFNPNSGTSVVVSSQIASYTLAFSDAGTVIEMNSSSATSITVPTDATILFPVGTVIEITQTGNGAVSIAGASGVTLHSPATFQTRTKWSSVGLRKRAVNDWLLSGDLG